MSPSNTTKITSRYGPVSVTTHLYGDVSFERYEQEKRVATHRAKMLDWTRPLPKIRIEPEDRDSYYDF